MYQEEKENKISPVILIITGIVALLLIAIFFFQVFTQKENDNETASINQKNTTINESWII